MLCANTLSTRDSQLKSVGCTEPRITFTEDHQLTTHIPWKNVSRDLSSSASALDTPWKDVGKSWLPLTPAVLTLKGPGTFLPPRGPVLQARWIDMDEHLHPPKLLLQTHWIGIEEPARRAQKSDKIKSRMCGFRRRSTSSAPMLATGGSMSCLTILRIGCGLGLPIGWKSVGPKSLLDTQRSGTLTLGPRPSSRPMRQSGLIRESQYLACLQGCGESGGFGGYHAVHRSHLPSKRLPPKRVHIETRSHINGIMMVDMIKTRSSI